MAGQWAGSDRRSTLPPDWATRVRPAILTRDDYRCTWLGDLTQDGRPGDYLQAVEWNILHLLGNRCASTATDVDHIGPPDDHTATNLRALCSWHHNHRSSRQGVHGRAQRAHLRQRPITPHPGLINPQGGG